MFGVKLEDTAALEPASAALDIKARTVHRTPTGKMLFEAGMPRRLFRIEAGAVCQFVRPTGDQSVVIEFAFPGDIIGLGQAATHASSAKAMVNTVFSEISNSELEIASQRDNRLFFRLAAAYEREFDYFRSRSLEGDLLPPLERLASYLLAISSIESSEGRDATIIADDCSSGFVAEQLQMSIDTLAAALLSLQRSSFIKASGKGLELLDLAGLERLKSKLSKKPSQ